MPANEPSDDDKWKALLQEYEPTSTAPAKAPGPQQPGRTKRVWPRNLAWMLAAGAVTAGVLHYEQRPAPAAVAAAPAPAPSPSATRGASAHAALLTAPVPLAAEFPATVSGPAGAVYTRVGMAKLASCTESDMVGPTLAGMIVQGHGCLGLQVALYKDAHKDQFNLALFTMKDPLDVIDLVTNLSTDPTDFEVGVSIPPPGSGLPALSATSGLVQQFASDGQLMLVGMGQWSDGRSSDYQQLENLLTPLVHGVSTDMAH